MHTLYAIVAAVFAAKLALSYPSFADVGVTIRICDRICEKGSYSLS